MVGLSGALCHHSQPLRVQLHLTNNNLADGAGKDTHDRHAAQDVDHREQLRQSTQQGNNQYAEGPSGFE
jgi:hypothetical protein